MSHLSQIEFIRAVRRSALPSHAFTDMPLIGLAASAHGAVRAVHTGGPFEARGYFQRRRAWYTRIGGQVAADARAYDDGVLRYIEWNSAASLDLGYRTLNLKRRVQFGRRSSVRACAHVLMADPGGKLHPRVLLWDRKPLSEKDAAMIALPVLEAVERARGAGSVGQVHVWHLGRDARHEVRCESARHVQGDVVALLEAGG